MIKIISTKISQPQVKFYSNIKIILEGARSWNLPAAKIVINFKKHLIAYRDVIPMKFADTVNFPNVGTKSKVINCDAET